MRRLLGRTAGLTAVVCLATVFWGTGEAHAQDTEELAPTAEPTEAATEATAEATEAAADESAPALTEDERKGLEEIVVSARKREERLQDVPISVTAVAGSTLEVQKITQTLGLQFRIPNMQFSKSNFTGSNLQIRGIGSVVVAASGEPAVGVHVNTVPQTASRIFEQEFYDVERIEVLRGPQGTLFGRNSTGGSFNIYTRKPTDELGGDGEIQFGNYSNVRLMGTLNLPIGDRLRARVGGMFRNRDGYITNIVAAGDPTLSPTIDDRQLWSVRGSFQLDITEDLQADLMVNYFREDDKRSRIGKQLCRKDTNPSPLSLGCTDGPQGFQTVTSHGTLGGILESYALASNFGPQYSVTSFAPTPVDTTANAINPPDLRVQAANRDPEYFADEVLAILDLHQDFDALTFNWTTGYQRTTVDSRQDYSMVSIPPNPNGDPPVQGQDVWLDSAIDALLTDFPTALTGQLSTPTESGCIDLGRFGCRNSSFAEDQSKAESDQISTELRGVSDYDGPLNFTAGAIFTYFSTYTDYKVFFSGAEIIGRLTDSVFPLPYDDELYHFNNETKPAITRSFGLFGEGYWSVTDSTRVTLGLRYTYDNKSARSRNYLLNTNTLGMLPNFEKQEATWNNGTGRISIDQQLPFGFMDDSMVFASGSRGTKPGGFNPPAVAGSLAPETFDQEVIWAFEAGTKNLFWDNRVQANLTGFFYWYDGYQVSKIVERTSVNENIDANVWGLEAEFVTKPVEALEVFFNVAYLGSSIKDSESIDPADPTAGDPNYIAVKDLASAANVLCDNPCPNPFAPTVGPGVDPNGFAKNLQGNKLPNTPDVQISVGGQYAIDGRIIPGAFTARMNYYWQSDMFGRMFNEERDYISSWSQADAGLRWNTDDGRIYVDFWIKNFMDNADITAHYLTDASSGNFTNAFILEPRTIGGTIGFVF
jgi:iron complex outermembrane receptor protein